MGVLFGVDVFTYFQEGRRFGQISRLVNWVSSRRLY